MRSIQRQTQAVQGGLYVLTGLWPLIDRRSFEAVTGEKTDWWLVNTVGLLLAVSGAVLIRGSGRPTGEMRLLGAGLALALAGVDTVYASRGRISKVYLADAAIEAAFAAGYAVRGADRAAALRSSIRFFRRRDGALREEMIH